MKHEKEINQLLHDLFYIDFMSDDEYNQIVVEVLKEMNTTKQELSDQLEIGLNNGYSIENQIKLVKASLNMICIDGNMGALIPTPLNEKIVNNML